MGKLKSQYTNANRVSISTPAMSSGLFYISKYMYVSVIIHAKMVTNVRPATIRYMIAFDSFKIIAVNI